MIEIDLSLALIAGIIAFWIGLAVGRRRRRSSILVSNRVSISIERDAEPLEHGPFPDVAVVVPWPPSRRRYRFGRGQPNSLFRNPPDGDAA